MSPRHTIKKITAEKRKKEYLVKLSGWVISLAEKNKPSNIYFLEKTREKNFIGFLFTIFFSSSLLNSSQVEFIVLFRRKWFLWWNQASFFPSGFCLFSRKMLACAPRTRMINFFAASLFDFVFWRYCYFMKGFLCSSSSSEKRIKNRDELRMKQTCVKKYFTGA